MLMIIKDVGNIAKHLKLVTIGGTNGITRNVQGLNRNQEATIVIRITSLAPNIAAVS